MVFLLTLTECTSNLNYTSKRLQGYKDASLNIKHVACVQIPCACLLRGKISFHVNPSDAEEQAQQPAARKIKERMLRSAEWSTYNTPSEGRQNSRQN